MVLEDVISRLADIFLSGIWMSPPKNKCTCDPFKRWINTVFQIKSKSVGRKTERELSRPRFVFYRSEAPQQAEARSTKIVFVGRNFSVELSLATCRVRVYEWIVKFEYDRTPRHRCKTPSSGTACFPPFLLPPPEYPREGLGWYGLIIDVVSWFT